MISKNYYNINGEISILDFFSALNNLYQDGILILLGVPIENEDIFKRLKMFEVKNNTKEINCGKSITFNIFGIVKTKNISLKYSNTAKDTLLDLSQKYIPENEICQCMYYLNPNTENCILEWKSVGSGDIHISRYEINSDEKIRKFCKDIDIDSYCLEMF